MERCEILWREAGERRGEARRVGQTANMRFSTRPTSAATVRRRAKALAAAFLRNLGVQRSRNPIYFSHLRGDMRGKVCTPSPATSVCEGKKGFKSIRPQNNTARGQ